MKAVSNLTPLCAPSCWGHSETPGLHTGWHLTGIWLCFILHPLKIQRAAVTDCCSHPGHGHYHDSSMDGQFILDGQSHFSLKSLLPSPRCHHAVTGGRRAAVPMLFCLLGPCTHERTKLVATVGELMSKGQLDQQMD